MSNSSCVAALSYVPVVRRCRKRSTKPTQYSPRVAGVASRWNARGCLLHLALVVVDGCPDEVLEGRCPDLVALEKIDRPPRIAFQTRVEELVRISQPRPVHEGEFHLAF